MKNLILIPVLFISTLIFSQTTLNASGGGTTIGTNTYDYSIGEMTVISTYSSPTLLVTQGVLQPTMENPSSVTTISNTQISIYPNPTQSILNIQSTAVSDGILNATLIDVLGKTILTEELDSLSGNLIHTMDITGVAAGYYMLKLQFKNQEITFKIQKTN